MQFDVTLDDATDSKTSRFVAEGLINKVKIHRALLTEKQGEIQQLLDNWPEEGPGDIVVETDEMKAAAKNVHKSLKSAVSVARKCD